MKTNLFNLSIVIYVLLSSISAYGQISKGGVPYSIKMKGQRAPAINGVIQNRETEDFSSRKVVLNKINNKRELEKVDALRKECSSCKQDYYGVGIDVNINLKTDAKKTKVENGTVWKSEITSVEAFGLQFYFSQYLLPDGAELFIYSPDHKYILGAFTADNNREDRRFATQVLPGKSAILEYFEPDTAPFKGELQIYKVIHSFKEYFSTRSGENSTEDFGISGDCNVDANCSAASAYSTEKQGVVKISFYELNLNYVGHCSASLVNSDDSTRPSYILTAAHCMDKLPENCHLLPPDMNEYCYPIEDADLIFEFGWEAISCGSTAEPTLPKTIQGGVLLTKGTESDYALLRIGTIPADYNPVYLGWDARTSLLPASAASIHHPHGDVKKFSKENNAPVKIRLGNSNTFPIAFPIEISGEKTHWRVNWDTGVTEPGSSGSFLMDHSTKRIIGQLHTGYSRCSDSPEMSDHCGDANHPYGCGYNNGPDYYGGLFYSWDNSDPGYSPLYFYLDPDKTYTKDTYIPSYPSHCTDGILSGNETGWDCGGSCPPCNTTGCLVTVESINLSTSCWNPGNTPKFQANISSECPFNYFDIIDRTVSPNKVVYQRDGDQVCKWLNGVWGCSTVSGSSFNTLPEVNLDYSWLSQPPTSFPDTREYSFLVKTINFGEKYTTRTFTVNHVNPLQLGPDKNVCVNIQTPIGISSANGYNFEWKAVSPANALNRLSSTTSINPIFSSSGTGTFTYDLVTIDPVTGCKGSDRIVVKVYSLSGSNKTFNTSFGSSIPISAEVTGTGSITYNWSPATYLNDRYVASPTFTAPSSVTAVNYSVTVANQGCQVTPQVSVNVLSNAPNNLVTTVQSDHIIHLTWADNSTTETGYKIERRKSGDISFESRVVLPPNTTSYDDVVLPNTSYEYKILNLESGLPQGYSQSATPKSNVALNRRLGGSAENMLFSIAPTGDGGYILGGETDSPVSGDVTISPVGNGEDFWLVKVDANFNKVWDKRFGSFYPDKFSKVVPSGDGGFIVGGTVGLNGAPAGPGPHVSSSGRGNEDFWILKINASGNKVWDKIYGGTNKDFLQDIVPTPDGGFILAGYSNSNASGDKSQNSKGGFDYWIVKINSSGTKIWDKTFGSSAEDKLHSIDVTSDGGFILGGNSAATSASGDKTTSSSGYWLVKASSSGAKSWDTTPNNLASVSSVVKPLKTGGYGIITNEIFFTVNSSGNINSGWSFSLSNHLSIYQQHKVDFIDLGSNGFLVAYSKYHSGDLSGYFLAKLNYCGEVEYSRIFRGNHKIDFSDLVLNQDGSVLLGGTALGTSLAHDISEPSKGEDDYWIVKVPVVGITDALALDNLNSNSPGTPMRADNITAPATSGSLVIGSGSSLTLEAREKITILPGFHAVNGSGFIGRTINLRSPGNEILCAQPYEGRMLSFESESMDEFSFIDEHPNSAISVNLYPNPNKGVFNLNIVSPTGGLASISIINSLGQRVLAYSIADASNATEQFDISTLAKGLYIVQIQIGDDLFKKRFIVD